MANPTSCPTLESWQQHLDGDLPTEQESEMTAHLGGCEACQKTVERFAAGGDTLLKVAGQVLAEATEAEPALRAVLANVPNPFDDAQAARKETIDVDYSFLQPPKEPGSLGQLGHYAILELIGRGGFGLVFRALDEKLRRVVAIKVLAPELAANASARRRFVREAQAVAAVRNEHVIAIYEVQETHQPPYLAMEFVEGQSLQQKIDRAGPLGTTAILRIGMQMAEGLAAAHKQGLIHRDIKPANVLLENGVERAKITDFGLARASDDATATHSGIIAGTPSYMSPEQAHGDNIDGRSDLFSLGSVLYAMAAGHAPFSANSAMAVLLRVTEKEPKPLRKINPAFPDWLADIIAKLHAKKPTDRFQSAREVADCLGQWLAHVQQPSTAPRPETPKRRFPAKAAFKTSAERLAMMIVTAVLIGAIALLYLSKLLDKIEHSDDSIAATNKVKAQREFEKATRKNDEPAKQKADERFPPAINLPPIPEPNVLPQPPIPDVTYAPMPAPLNNDANRPQAANVLDVFTRASSDWLTDVNLLLPLPGEARQAHGAARATRECHGRYVRLRTYGLPNSQDMLQFIDFNEKSGVFQSWLFDSNGNDFSPMHGTWNVAAETLTFFHNDETKGRYTKQTIGFRGRRYSSAVPGPNGPKVVDHFATDRLDCALKVSFDAPKVMTGLTWSMIDPDPKSPQPPPSPEPVLGVSKQQELLFQLEGESVMDVAYVPELGGGAFGSRELLKQAERKIVRLKWAKSLGGLVMEGSLHDPIADETTILLAYYDNHAKVYRLWLLPDKGEPAWDPGLGNYNDETKVLTWKMGVENVSITELHWKFVTSDRCDWTMKKVNFPKDHNQGIIPLIYEWTSRGTVRPKAPAPPVNPAIGKLPPPPSFSLPTPIEKAKTEEILPPPKVVPPPSLELPHLQHDRPNQEVPKLDEAIKES